MLFRSHIKLRLLLGDMVKDVREQVLQRYPGMRSAAEKELNDMFRTAILDINEFIMRYAYMEIIVGDEK